MAVRDLVQTGVGLVEEPQAVQLKNGTLTPAAVNEIVGKLRSLAFTVNAISFGDGSQAGKAGNLDAQYITTLTPTVANTEFQIDHGLKRLVIGVVPVLTDKAAHVYASNTGSWTDASILLKCDVASATIRLLVF
jgi:hypothetical protein